jgi:hypothetical protein
MHRINEYINHLAEVFEVLTLQHSLKHAFTAHGVQISAHTQPKETERGLLYTLAAVLNLFSISF